MELPAGCAGSSEESVKDAALVNHHYAGVGFLVTPLLTMGVNPLIQQAGPGGGGHCFCPQFPI